MLGTLFKIGRHLVPFLDPIGKVADKLAEAYLQKQNAETEQQRIEAESKIAMLEARKDALVHAQSRSKWPMIMRGVFGVPVAVVLWKLLVFDKALGQWTGGHTDALDQNLWWVIMLVLTFYFAGEMYNARKD